MGMDFKRTLMALREILGVQKSEDAEESTDAPDNVVKFPSAADLVPRDELLQDVGDAFRAALVPPLLEDRLKPEDIEKLPIEKLLGIRPEDWKGFSEEEQETIIKARSFFPQNELELSLNWPAQVFRVRFPVPVTAAEANEIVDFTMRNKVLLHISQHGSINSWLEGWTKNTEVNGIIPQMAVMFCPEAVLGENNIELESDYYMGWDFSLLSEKNIVEKDGWCFQYGVWGERAG
jgi:hypothetical protein